MRNDVGRNHASDFPSLGEVDNEILIVGTPGDWHGVADPHGVSAEVFHDIEFLGKLKIGIEIGRGGCRVQRKGRWVPGKGSLIRNKEIGSSGVFKVLKEKQKQCSLNKLMLCQP